MYGSAALGILINLLILFIPSVSTKMIGSPELNILNSLMAKYSPFLINISVSFNSIISVLGVENLIRVSSSAFVGSPLVVNNSTPM